MNTQNTMKGLKNINLAVVDFVKASRNLDEYTKETNKRHSEVNIQITDAHWNEFCQICADMNAWYVGKFK